MYEERVGFNVVDVLGLIEVLFLFYLPNTLEIFIFCVVSGEDGT